MYYKELGKYGNPRGNWKESNSQTSELKNWKMQKIYKYLEVKHIPEQSMSQRRNQKGNQKVSKDKQKWKQALLREKFMVVNAYINKKKDCK